MKFSFIVASVVALGTFARAQDAATSTAPASHRIEVTVVLDATRVTAVNHGAHTQVLLFQSAEHGPRVARTLPPAGELDVHFPRHALHGARLELVTVRDAGGALGLANSGTVALDAAHANGVDTVVFQSTEQGTVTWLERDGDFTTNRPDGTLVPPTVIQRVETLKNGRDLLLLNASASSAHVPVVTPRDKPDDYGPPELEDKPLPPV